MANFCLKITKKFPKLLSHIFFIFIFLVVDNSKLWYLVFALNYLSKYLDQETAK